jgi:hypothetical protein
LTIFSFLIACQALIHQETFRDWVHYADPVGWLLTFSLVLLLVRPWSLLLLMGALTLNLVNSWLHLPYGVNHLLFEDLINLTILTAILAVLFQRWRAGTLDWRTFNSREMRKEIFDMFVPVVRIGVILLYFFVTLAKLNIDFFDPVISCAAGMYRDITPAGINLSDPLFAWTPTAAVWGTILAEGGIPILLLFKRTRTLAIVSGLFFHLLLGFHPHQGVYSFTAMMYMLYFLFTGEGFTATVNAQLNQLVDWLRKRGSLRQYLIGAVILGAVFAVSLFFIAVGYMLDWFELGANTRIGFWFWLVWALAIIAFYLYIFWKTPAEERSFSAPLFPNRGLLWIFVVLILINGFMPYFGFKTETSFAMFSNLRTEELRTNHFFMPTGLHIADYQQDLVEITDTDHPTFEYYQENHLLLTRFEFERLLHDIQEDFSVSCDCYGTSLDITKEDGVLSGHRAEEMSYTPLLGRFFLFRPVSQADQMPCSH